MASASLRKLPRWELGIFVGALLLRLWLLSRYTTTPYSALQMGDMKFYHDWAVRILGGEWTDGAAFYGLPGYAYLLAGFYWILGTGFPVDWLVIGGVQSVLETITAVLIFKIGSRCLADERVEASAKWIPWAAAAGSLAYALFVPAQAYSIILMPTAWLVCAYWWCVWKAMTTEANRPLWVWLGLGVLIGVVTMMIATILFVLGLLLAAIALRVRKWRALAAAALLMAGVGLGTSPAWLHNYFVAHDPVLLSAHGGLNFYMGNNPSANGYPKIPEGLRPSQDGLLRDSIKWAEAEAGHPLKRTEVSKYWGAKANAYIHEHPWEWLRLMGVKVRNFWNGFQYDDISVVQLMEERGVALPGPGFSIVSAIGLTGFVLIPWRNRQARWVVCAVLLHMAALLSVFITERYRLAAVPGLIILGVCVVYRLLPLLPPFFYTRFKTRPGATRLEMGQEMLLRRWPGSVIIFTFIACAFATWGATRDPALLSLAPYNLGVKELEVGDLYATRNKDIAAQEYAFANRHLDQAYLLMPGNAGIRFALGNLSLSQGDPATARDWYQRTLELSPNYAPALKNLGYLATQDQQWAQAVPWLESARAVEPDNATTWYLLALSKFRLGDPEAARPLLKEALRMKPDHPSFLELARELAQP